MKLFQAGSIGIAVAVLTLNGTMLSGCGGSSIRNSTHSAESREWSAYAPYRASSVPSFFRSEAREAELGRIQSLPDEVLRVWENESTFFVQTVNMGNGEGAGFDPVAIADSARYFSIRRVDGFRTELADPFQNRGRDFLAIGTATEGSLVLVRGAELAVWDGQRWSMHLREDLLDAQPSVTRESDGRVSVISPRLIYLWNGTEWSQAPNFADTFESVEVEGSSAEEHWIFEGGFAGGAASWDSVSQIDIVASANARYPNLAMRITILASGEQSETWFTLRDVVSGEQWQVLVPVELGVRDCLNQTCTSEDNDVRTLHDVRVDETRRQFVLRFPSRELRLATPSELSAIW